MPRKNSSTQKGARAEQKSTASTSKRRHAQSEEREERSPSPSEDFEEGSSQDGLLDGSEEDGSEEDDDDADAPRIVQWEDDDELLYNQVEEPLKSTAAPSDLVNYFVVVKSPPLTPPHQFRVI